jgi:hypothetical protein
MPFFVLEFNKKECQVVENLKHTLAHSPNGTPLCCGNIIYTTDKTWVYWFDSELTTAERLNSIRSLEGVATFYELPNVITSIYDPCWVWETDYIYSALQPHVAFD